MFIIEGINTCRVVCARKIRLYQGTGIRQRGYKWKNSQRSIRSFGESRAHPFQPLLEDLFEQRIARVNDAEMAMAALKQVSSGKVAGGKAGKDDSWNMLHWSGGDQHDIFHPHLARERHIASHIRQLPHNKTSRTSSDHP